MATFNFQVKIESGKRTDLKVTTISTAVNNKEIKFNERPVKMTTTEMETLIEAAVEKSIKEFLGKCS